MRSEQPGALLHSVVEVLEAQVLPHVHDKRARATLLLCAGIMENLSARIEEDPRFVEQMRGRLLEMVRTAPNFISSELDDVADPRQLLTRYLRLVEPRDSAEPSNEVDQWLKRCLPALRAYNDLEISRLRPTRYLRSQEGNLLE